MDFGPDSAHKNLIQTLNGFTLIKHGINPGRDLVLALNDEIMSAVELCFQAAWRN
jgi:hypothetical protein